MKDAKFTKLINKAEQMAYDHRHLLKEIDDESVRRHGYHPSQIDCDYIIDAVQYGIAGGLSAEEFDKHMKEAIEIKTDFHGNVRSN